MAEPTFPLERLRGFRAELHACFPRRADALFELGDALLCAQAVPSLPHLSLQPVHQCGWGSSTYAALAHGRVDTEALRDLLARHRLQDGQSIYAVDISTWPRCDAETSPERGFYYHPPGTRPDSRSWLVGRSNGSPSSALPVTVGPRRSMRCGYTRWTTTTRLPSPRSAPSSSGCPPATGRCHCSCSTPAMTPALLAWGWPRSARRSWSDCAQVAASTPTRHLSHARSRVAGHVGTAPSSTPATRQPGPHQRWSTSKMTTNTVV
jgi:hypothetical protein